jgi:hypothetical protein
MANAVELQNLEGLEDIFGRDAPGGDCRRQPQIRVDVSGLTFDIDGKRENVTNPEQALVNGSPSTRCK